jgi:hypothetical protein
MPDIDEYITAQEAARILRRELSALTRYVRQGFLKPVWKGGVRLFLRSEVERFQPPPVGNPNFRRRKS